MNDFRKALRDFLNAKEAEMDDVFAIAVADEYLHDEVARVLVYTIQGNTVIEHQHIVRRRPNDEGVPEFLFSKLS